MHEIHRTDGEKKQYYVYLRASHQLSFFYEWLCTYIVVGRADFHLFSPFENATDCLQVGRHAGSRQFCLLAFVVVL